MTKWPGPRRVCFSSETDSSRSRPTRPRRGGGSARSRTRSRGQRADEAGLVEDRHAGSRRSTRSATPPRSAMPVIIGVGIVQVWSISGGATISRTGTPPPPLGVGVDGVGVLEGGRPVPDHRLVHRVGGDGAPSPPGGFPMRASSRARKASVSPVVIAHCYHTTTVGTGWGPLASDELGVGQDLDERGAVVGDRRGECVVELVPRRHPHPECTAQLGVRSEVRVVQDRCATRRTRRPAAPW